MSTDGGSDATAGDVTQSAAATASDQRGIGDILGQESAMQYVKYNAGVFLGVGLGFALAMVLTHALADTGSSGMSGVRGGLVIFGLFIAIMFSPMLAGITGSITSLRFDETEKAVATAAAAGAFVGYVALLLLIIVTANVVADGGGGGGSSTFSDLLLPLLGFGIGVAAAGAISAVVTERFA